MPKRHEFPRFNNARIKIIKPKNIKNTPIIFSGKKFTILYSYKFLKEPNAFLIEYKRTKTVQSMTDKNIIISNKCFLTSFEKKFILIGFIFSLLLTYIAFPITSIKKIPRDTI